MPARQRLVLIGLAVVVLVAAFVIARGSGDNGKRPTPSRPSPPRKARGPPGRRRRPPRAGARPRRADRGRPRRQARRRHQEAHVHQGRPGRVPASPPTSRTRSTSTATTSRRTCPRAAPSRSRFRGKIDGIFVVELESRGRADRLARGHAVKHRRAGLAAAGAGSRWPASPSPARRRVGARARRPRRTCRSRAGCSRGRRRSCWSSRSSALGALWPRAAPARTRRAGARLLARARAPCEVARRR